MEQEKKRGLLKRVMLEQKAMITREINKLEEYIRVGNNIDFKVCYTKLTCLHNQLNDIEELIQICKERNKF